MIPFLALGLWCALAPQDPDRDPEPGPVAAAVAAYRDARYAEAVVLFDAALDRPDAPRAAIYHDLGNCAYRLGRHAEAVLAYRRAQHRRPDDPAIAFDLQLAERQLGIDRAAARAFDVPPPDRYRLPLAVVLQTVGLAGLLFGSRRGWGRRAAAALATLAGVVVAAQLLSDGAAGEPRTGVVLAPQVTVRPEPHRDLPGTATLRAGEPLRVEEASDRWARVVHARGRGWVPVDGLGFVTH